MKLNIKPNYAQNILTYYNKTTKIENEWANEEINNYLLKKENENPDNYINNVVNSIYNKLLLNLKSSEVLDNDFNIKKIIKDLITKDKDVGHKGMSIYDCYDVGIPSFKASDQLYKFVHSYLMDTKIKRRLKKT